MQLNCRRQFRGADLIQISPQLCGDPDHGPAGRPRVASTRSELCGHALVISRAVRMARLREAQEHPDWKWEGERRRAIRDRVEATRGLPAGPWSGSPQSCGEIWIRSASRNCRRQLSCTHQGHYPLPEYGASLAATGSTRQNTGQRLRNFAAAHRTAARSAATAPKWLWLPSTRRRRHRMKSIRNSISNACWALSQLPSC